MDKFIDWLTHDFLIIISVLIAIVIGLLLVMSAADIAFAVRDGVAQRPEVMIW